MLNSIMEEGLKNVMFYGVRKEFKQPVRCGVIAAITRAAYDARERHWRSIGFVGRCLLVSFSYSDPTKLKIHEHIICNHCTPPLNKVGDNEVEICYTPLPLALPFGLSICNSKSRFREGEGLARLVRGRSRVALRYWRAFSSVIPESLDFQGRITSTHQNNASDPVNLALNYAYGALEGECRAAINTVGLEPSVGFLHESSGYQTKQSLVYDLQEPFRWIADVAVIEAFESEVLDLPDFYFTGDEYRYRFEPEAKERFLDLLREKFNSSVRYKGRMLKWDTVIEQKAVELGSHLVGRSAKPDFSQPAPRLPVTDDRELRRRILSLTQSDAKKLGIEKSTLHNLRSRAMNPCSLKIYAPVRKRLVWKEN